MLGFATPGITPAKLTSEPIGTEGEMTPGPDDVNPYEDPRYMADMDAQEPHVPHTFDLF